MPAAPMRRSLRRPRLSTAHIPGRVETTLTTLVTTVDDEWIRDTGLSEECSSIVEDELEISKNHILETHVDTSKLLPSLEENSSEHTITVVSRTVPEAVDIRSLAHRFFVS